VTLLRSLDDDGRKRARLNVLTRQLDVTGLYNITASPVYRGPDPAGAQDGNLPDLPAAGR